MKNTTIPFDQQSFPPKGIAEVLKCSLSKTFELIAADEIETFKIGRARRATGAAINAFIKRNAASPKPKRRARKAVQS